MEIKPSPTIIIIIGTIAVLTINVHLLIHQIELNSQENSTATSQSNSNKKKRKRLSDNDDCPIHRPTHKRGQGHQNQYGGNFRPRCTNAATLRSTSSSVQRPNQSVNVLLPPPPTQVYFQQRNQDSNSHLSTPSHGNYTKTPSRDNSNKYNNTYYYVSHNTENKLENFA